MDGGHSHNVAQADAQVVAHDAVKADLMRFARVVGDDDADGLVAALALLQRDRGSAAEWCVCWCGKTSKGERTRGA
jgi:hypothetical protein